MVGRGERGCGPIGAAACPCCWLPLQPSRGGAAGWPGAALPAGRGQRCMLAGPQVLIDRAKAPSALTPSARSTAACTQSRAVSMAEQALNK